MSEKVAIIYKKFINTNSKKFTSVDDGLDMYMRDIKMKCFDDQKIINAYKTLRKITDTSNLNIAGILLNCMVNNIEQNPFNENAEDIDNKLFNFDIACNTNKLTRKHFEFILKYEKEILYHIDVLHF